MNLVRIVAPIWMAAAGLVAAIAGAIGYLVVGALVSSFPVDVPDPVVMPLYILFVASPIVIAFVVLRRVSRTLYRHDPVTVAAVLLHVWHCALLYPLLAYTVFLGLTCPGASAPIMDHCADPLGTSMAAGVVALGGIVADGVAAYQRHRPIVARAG